MSSDMAHAVCHLSAMHFDSYSLIPYRQHFFQESKCLLHLDDLDTSMSSIGRHGNDTIRISPRKSSCMVPRRSHSLSGDCRFVMNFLESSSRVGCK